MAVKELKIGVDAKSLCGTITGIGRYTIEMCKALSTIPGVSLYLYSPSPINEEIVKAIGPKHYRSGTINSRVVRQLWCDTSLPMWANTDGVEVLWGPSHRLPRFIASHIVRVVTIHDLVWIYASQTMSSLTRFLERLHMPAAIKKADRIVAVSSATAKSIAENYRSRANRVATVLEGADHMTTTPDTTVLESYNISGPYCLFVGTLEPRKNLANLLAAYAKLPQEVKEKCTLLVAGGKGWGDVNLAETIKKLELEAHVLLLGYVDEPTLAALYSQARFLVMPSLYEGFGLPLVEAMTYGTPVLTSNNSSMIEVAGDAGILVDPLDLDSITQGLLQLITDDKLHSKLSQNATKHVAQFTWSRAAEQLTQVLHEAVAERKIAS